MAAWKNFGQARPAETYRANKPSKVKGRGSFNRQVAAQRKVDAEAAERGKVVVVGYNAMQAATSGSDNVVLVRKEAEIKATPKPLVLIAGAVDTTTHDAKLAARRERDRAKRAAAKAGTVAVIDGGATGMVLRSLAAQGHI